MNSSWRWKAIVATFAMLMAAWLVAPNFVDTGDAKSWTSKVLPDSQIRLGLDLQGGIHMVLGIDLQRALINEADRYARDLQEFLPKDEIPVVTVDRTYESTELKVKLREKEDVDKFERFLTEKYSILVITARDDAQSLFTLDIDPQRKADIEHQTVQQALETLRNRLDEFGVAEPSIQAQGKDRIVVQLPGLADPQRAKNVLGRTAQLEFKIVDDESMDAVKVEALVAEAKKSLPPNARIEQLNRALHDKLPPNTQVLMKEDKDPTTGKTVETPFLLQATTWLTGEMLEDARIGVGEFNEPVVNLAFNPRGAEILDKVTSEHLNKRLAIILDDKVQSDPVLRARISDGRAQISFGSLKGRAEIMEEAKDLSLVLRAGALPAPVEILQNQAVGPSLGRDSIENGMKAILLGAAMILAFMAIYYRWSGMAANFALICNLIFIFACLGGLHATLTLPGLAGILISTGMAVDANVLIYERIREELRDGKPVKAAVEAGYDRAHVTIIDSNLTTIITAIVLMQYGTGPIKGFAVTLIFGLIANYFTALWFTRLAFEWVLGRFELKRLSI